MPTGYTADIANGITFQEYALKCARNFGALIMMRDEPMDAPIPDEFAHSDYHIKELEKAEKEMAELTGSDIEQLTRLANEKYRADRGYYEQATIKRKELKAKYDAMLAQAKAYVPPTDQHVEYAKFLVTQIEASISWDCAPSFPKKPINKTGLAYKKERLKALQWSIDYHTKNQADEIKRSRDRSEWVKQLKQSLSIPLTDKK